MSTMRITSSGLQISSPVGYSPWHGLVRRSAETRYLCASCTLLICQILLVMADLQLQ
jgi:hypothetical protein